MPGLIRSQSNINLAPGGLAPPDSLYFSSNEVPFADSILTSDFRTGWYSKTEDQNTANGTPYQNGGADGKGWGGNDQGLIGGPGGTGPLPVGSNASVNLAALALKPLFTKSDFVGSTSPITPGANQRNNAYHNLLGGSAGHSEIYARGYKFFVPANYYGPGNPSTSFTWGGQKSWTFNQFGADAGIFGVVLDIM